MMKNVYNAVDGSTPKDKNKNAPDINVNKIAINGERYDINFESLGRFSILNGKMNSKEDEKALDILISSFEYF
jgi:hypothetical protein